MFSVFFSLYSFPAFELVLVERNLAGCHEIRYDVRAALTDIAQYEPPPGGYDNRWEYLSAAEQRGMFDVFENFMQYFCERLRIS